MEQDEEGDDDLPLAGDFADSNFTREELDFIQDGWGDSESFMLSFNLKFYKEDDCEKAKAIVRAFMAQDDDLDSDWHRSELGGRRLCPMDDWMPSRRQTTEETEQRD